MNVVLDTNVLIDFLAGDPRARIEVARHDAPAMSRITAMELLVGARDARAEAAIRAFVARFVVPAADPTIRVPW